MHQHRPRRLLDDISRDDGRPMRDDESAFDFLNRVDRPYWAAIRHELEDWFAAFPTEEAESLRSRYRSRRREQHYAAWWELYLHRLFRALGFQVTVHPRLPGVGGRPDFLISNGQDRFLLEAATTFSGVVDPHRDEDRENCLRATIRGARTPNFFVSLHVQVAGKETPSVQEIVGPIERWLGSLDADEILATQVIPERRFAPRDWEFELHALPVSLEHRGDPEHEILGSYMGAVGWINDAEKLRRALENKRRKYGSPEVPLVVAVLLCRRTSTTMMSRRLSSETQRSSTTKCNRPGRSGRTTGVRASAQRLLVPGRQAPRYQESLES